MVRINWDVLDEQFAPKRRVTNKKSRFRNITGFYKSRLMGRRIDYSSISEYIFFSKLEISKATVYRYYPQPVEIPVPFFDAKKGLEFWNYVPDVIVIYLNNQVTIYEIKSDSRSHDENSNKIRWDSATRFAQKRGWGFEVVVPSECFSREEIYNYKFLVNFRNPPVYLDSLYCIIMESLGKKGAMPIVSLANEFVDIVDPRLVITCIFHLISLNEIGFDMSTRISLETPIWVNKE